MSRFDVRTTPLEALLVFRRLPIVDERGYLERLYCFDEFQQRGIPYTVAQINHTLTRKKGTVRGMHYQLPPHTEAKLVMCVRGQVYDVAVDLRSKSPTFLRWHAELLTEENRLSFFIPKGFAHGFQTLSDDCEMLYLHSAPYAPSSEAGIQPTDARLDISWPLAIDAISDRDRRHQALTSDFGGLPD